MASSAHHIALPALKDRLLDVFSRTFDLGFTSFGGPPVHFQIFHRRFVDGLGKAPWIDEQTYQELFTLSQALPGPASTKMLFNIAQIHAGLVPALFVFLIWSLPGAIGMFCLSLGVERLSETLPGPVYAFLSGLNSATVGIIALAAVQLSRKAIIDSLTRILVVFGACAGLCYTALWYFPVLLISAGILTASWDSFGHGWFISFRNRMKDKWKRKRDRTEPESGISLAFQPVNLDPSSLEHPLDTSPNPTTSAKEAESQNIASSEQDASRYRIPAKAGLALIVLFFSMFATFMALRGSLHPAPLILSLFNNMFLAGTIIFGGGPVVIPLLRDYVVDPGWVSSRDFLLGLAVIQAMPGPNFNFAIYLGALVAKQHFPVPVGALLAFLGIFTPGLWLSVAFQSLWYSLKKRRVVKSVLRGMNAAAVGFIFTAVYRLWQIGYLTPQSANGTSLAGEPWWLVIAASTFTLVEWFSLPPPISIIGGGVAGLAWYGVNAAA